MQNSSASQKHQPFCEPPNTVVNDPTPANQAVYVPSVTPGYAKDVFKNRWRRSLPTGVMGADLNFLDPVNQLFRISHVMSSAGQALNQKRDCIVTTRDRQHTKLICDSGGYQVASDRLVIRGNADILKILRWIEQHGDLGMTLDVPTGPLLTNPKYRYASFQDCLNTTLGYLQFFQSQRQDGAVKLLNVLQGNTVKETDVWYDAVKAYDFEGWAFAGKLRHNIYALCRRILIMAHEGQLQKKHWIHVLGTNELDTAVLLTALQRAINKHINPILRISYDTSSAFRNLNWNQAYDLPVLDTKRMTMPTHDAPQGRQFVGSAQRWPYESPLGNLMSLGDFAAPTPNKSGRYRDTQGDHLLANHNLGALCFGIAHANRVFDCAIVAGQNQIGIAVGKAVAAIDTVIASGQLTVLHHHRKSFSGIRHSVKFVDEDRSVFD